MTARDYEELRSTGNAPRRPDSIAAAWGAVPRMPTTAVFELSAPEDLLLYGEAPGGKLITCVIRATGESVAGPVAADGSFALLVPAEIYATGEEGFRINVTVTDGGNRQLVKHGASWPATPASGTSAPR